MVEKFANTRTLVPKLGKALFHSFNTQSSVSVKHHLRNRIKKIPFKKQNFLSCLKFRICIFTNHLRSCINWPGNCRVGHKGRKVWRMTCTLLGVPVPEGDENTLPFSHMLLMLRTPSAGTGRSEAAGLVAFAALLPCKKQLVSQASCPNVPSLFSSSSPFFILLLYQLLLGYSLAQSHQVTNQQSEGQMAKINPQPFPQVHPKLIS